MRNVGIQDEGKKRIYRYYQYWQGIMNYVEKLFLAYGFASTCDEFTPDSRILTPSLLPQPTPAPTKYYPAGSEKINIQGDLHKNVDGNPFLFLFTAIFFN